MTTPVSITDRATPSRDDSELVSSSRIGAGAYLIAVGVVVAAGLAGLVIGPLDISATGVVVELVDKLPLISVDSGLTDTERVVVESLRLPRVALGFLVGATLSLSGAACQGAFRNPLVDPYILGIGAGAGLGATLAIATGLGDGLGGLDPVPLAAFVGALVAVATTWAAGQLGGRSPVSLVLAGIAVTAFLTACQTYVLQSNTDVIREVYSWILGSLTTSGWSEPGLLLPYFIITFVVVMRYARALDVLAFGDEEAASLGIRPERVRIIVVVVASLGAAAAVSVSGLIGFVGIIVPHAVRLAFGAAHRVLMPLVVLLGGAFTVLADLVARTALEPAELPIGVITAFLGAPFFVMVLRTSRRNVW